VPLHNAFGDIQAQSDTPSIILCDLNEPIEDRFQLVLGNPRTRIVDTEENLFAALFDAHDHPTAGGRELDRVVQEVAEHLKNPCGIERDGRQRWHDLRHQRHAVSRGLRLKRVHGFLHDVRRVAHFTGHREHARFNAGDVNEVPDESPHPDTGSLHAPLADALGAALEEGLVQNALIAASGAQAARLWKMRESLVEAQQAAGGSIAHDVSVPVSRIPEFIARADAAVETACPGIRRCCFGHVGDGNMHYNPIKPADWDRSAFREQRPRINRIVHDIIADLSGSISAEHGVGRSRLVELEHYKTDIELGLMRTLKAALDPRGIMNPGKILRE